MRAEQDDLMIYFDMTVYLGLRHLNVELANEISFGMEIDN